uniref:GPI mannosyltransferase 2 n=1 Tax=Rhipicephalus microplus TaxID=6941 RepID=A0A6M2CVE9_RHIMP
MYYRLKQMPNFILALPVVIVILHSSAFALKRCSDSRHIPYLLHVVGFLMITVLFANVQVVTRLIAASSPVLYWTTFLGFNQVERKSRSVVWADVAVNLWQSDIHSKRIVTYFLGYAVLGTALHVNFLPWT